MAVLKIIGAVLVGVIIIAGGILVASIMGVVMEAHRINKEDRQ